MKLNAPASSSDLDRARTIARRLHDRGLQRTGGVSTAPAAPPAKDTPPPPTAPTPERSTASRPEPPAFQPPDFNPPLPEKPAPSVPAAASPPELEVPDDDPPGLQPPELEPPARRSDTEPEIELEPDSEPQLPSTDAGGSSRPAASPTEALGLEPDAEIEIETGLPGDEASPLGSADFDVPPVDTPVFEAPEFEVPDAEEPELLVPEEASDGSSNAGPEKISPDTGSWSSDSGPDDGLGELTPPAAVLPPEELEHDDPFAEVPTDAVSPEDLLADEIAEPPKPFDIGEPLLASDATDPGASEDLTAPGTPAWGDVADSCLAQAGAHGTMLVDPTGQVLTARGDWPEPGPDAIAGRLVSMMERTLQDAPTRSVSAPIAGRHLTAWRIPANDGYLTVVFMGDAPLRTDVRPTIDELIRGTLAD